MSKDPQAIDEESSRIIEDEIGAHSFSAGQLAVVKRVIHATADFDFARDILFHPIAVEAGIAAIKSGADIIADVQTVEVGISKEGLKKHGGSVWCFISDEDVVQKSKDENVPRPIMAMRKAAEVSDGAVYAIGNTPLALLELIRLMETGKAKPSLIVGVPVGFVLAAESKEALLSTGAPFITCRGRKGGSPAAAAIVNALALLAGSDPAG